MTATALGAQPPAPETPAMTDAIGTLAWWTPGTWVGVLCASAALASVWQIGLGRIDRGFFVLALTAIVLTAAAVVDTASMRIPNRLTYPAIVLGLVINVLLAPALHAGGLEIARLWLGSPGAITSLLGLAACATFGIGSFAAGGLGGGDAKTLMAVGVLLGLGDTLPVVFNAILVAAVIGLGNLVLRGHLIGALQRLGQVVVRAAWPGLLVGDPEQFKRTQAPFTLSLLVGFVLAQVLSPLGIFLDVTGALARQLGGGS